MVASNTRKIRCLILAVPVNADRSNGRGALAHDMVPGDDPYVARLIKKLQDEVRSERRAEAALRSHDFRVSRDLPLHDIPGSRMAEDLNELELPWHEFETPSEDTPPADERWSANGDETDDTSLSR